MKLEIAWTGKTKNPAIQSLTEEYLQRLSHYAEVEGVSLKDETAILKLSQGSSRSRARHLLILLDREGKQMSSEEFAKFLGNHRDRNPLPLLFAIGPASGFLEKTLQAADMRLSLGSMTIAHELARVLLLEQLYRAFTILNHQPYHLAH